MMNHAITASWKQLKAMTEQQWTKFSCGFSLLVGKRESMKDRESTKAPELQKDRGVR